MSYIITRQPLEGLGVMTEEVYCIHNLKEMGGRMFGNPIWCKWKDSGIPNHVMTFWTQMEAETRLSQLVHKDPNWIYKVDFYDR